jgi:hypothetical protein
LPNDGARFESAISLDEVGLKRAAVRSRVDLGSMRTFGFSSPFSNAIACLLEARLKTSNIVDATKKVDELKRCLGIELVKGVISNGGIVTAFVSAEEWVALVVRSFLRATFEASAPLEPRDEISLEVNTGEVFLVIRRTQDVIVRIPLGVRGDVAGDSVTMDNGVPIGRPWYSGDHNDGRVIRVLPNSDGVMVSSLSAFVSPVLLLPIGDAAIELARGLERSVASIIEIDDRPVTGGGLPDFWQSNLGRVIRVSLGNPNINSVVAVGDEKGASETLQRLRMSPEEWTEAIPDLQHRLSISVEHLKSFAKRFPKFSVIPCEESALLAAIVQITSSADSVSTRRAIDVAGETSRRRRLPLGQAADSGRLKASDGLRARTLADAYPRAIQSLREDDQVPQSEPYRGEFKEFLAFKVQLSSPTQDRVPDYWQGEQDTLDRYYQRNFVDRETGIFAQRLLRKVGNQTARDAAVAAVVEALGGKHPTRRILLPLAQVAESFSDITHPLGLTAIQLLPRQRGGRWYLDFGWVWRTVEALVGFPFSAYGSIRWSEDFLKSAQEQFAVISGGPTLEFGELNYIALSFHMFTDVGDAEIARAIVADAIL